MSTCPCRVRCTCQCRCFIGTYASLFHPHASTLQKPYPQDPRTSSKYPNSLSTPQCLMTPSTPSPTCSARKGLCCDTVSHNHSTSLPSTTVSATAPKCSALNTCHHRFSSCSDKEGTMKPCRLTSPGDLRSRLGFCRCSCFLCSLGLWCRHTAWSQGPLELSGPPLWGCRTQTLHWFWRRVGLAACRRRGGGGCGVGAGRVVWGCRWGFVGCCRSWRKSSWLIED